MVSNKKRLYIALYPSGVRNKDERKYHWAFIIGPKDKTTNVPSTRYHVKNHPVNGWAYEEHIVSDAHHVNNLARILIAKVQDEDRLEEILRHTPVVQNDPHWRCRSWIADALLRIENDGTAVGTSQLKWDTIEREARRYVQEKIEQGRYQRVDAGATARPTWDMLEGVEVAP